jgi:hypothetical protein
MSLTPKKLGANDNLKEITGNIARQGVADA